MGMLLDSQDTSILKIVVMVLFLVLMTKKLVPMIHSFRRPTLIIWKGYWKLSRKSLLGPTIILMLLFGLVVHGNTVRAHLEATQQAQLESIDFPRGHFLVEEKRRVHYNSTDALIDVYNHVMTEPFNFPFTNLKKAHPEFTLSSETLKFIPITAVALTVNVTDETLTPAATPIYVLWLTSRIETLIWGKNVPNDLLGTSGFIFSLHLDQYNRKLAGLAETPTSRLNITLDEGRSWMPMPFPLHELSGLKGHDLVKLVEQLVFPSDPEYIILMRPSTFIAGLQRALSQDSNDIPAPPSGFPPLQATVLFRVKLWLNPVSLVQKFPDAVNLIEKDLTNNSVASDIQILENHLSSLLEEQQDILERTTRLNFGMGIFFLFLLVGIFLVTWNGQLEQRMNFVKKFKKRGHSLDQVTSQLVVLEHLVLHLPIALLVILWLLASSLIPLKIIFLELNVIIRSISHMLIILAVLHFSKEILVRHSVQKNWDRSFRQQLNQGTGSVLINILSIVVLGAFLHFQASVFTPLFGEDVILIEMLAVLFVVISLGFIVMLADGTILRIIIKPIITAITKLIHYNREGRRTKEKYMRGIIPINEALKRWYYFSKHYGRLFLQFVLVTAIFTSLFSLSYHLEMSIVTESKVRLGGDIAIIGFDWNENITWSHALQDVKGVDQVITFGLLSFTDLSLKVDGIPLKIQILGVNMSSLSQALERIPTPKKGVIQSFLQQGQHDLGASLIFQEQGSQSILDEIGITDSNLTVRVPNTDFLGQFFIEIPFKILGETDVFPGWGLFNVTRSSSPTLFLVTSLSYLLEQLVAVDQSFLTSVKRMDSLIIRKDSPVTSVMVAIHDKFHNMTSQFKVEMAETPENLHSFNNMKYPLFEAINLLTWGVIGVMLFLSVHSCFLMRSLVLKDLFWTIQTPWYVKRTIRKHQLQDSIGYFVFFAALHPFFQGLMTGYMSTVLMLNPLLFSLSFQLPLSVLFLSLGLFLLVISWEVHGRAYLKQRRTEAGGR